MVEDRENRVCKRVSCVHACIRARREDWKISVWIAEVLRPKLERYGENWVQLEEDAEKQKCWDKRETDLDRIGARWIEKELIWVMIQRCLSLGSCWEGEGEYGMLSRIFCGIACCWVPLIRVHPTNSIYLYYATFFGIILQYVAQCWSFFLASPSTCSPAQAVLIDQKMAHFFCCNNTT